MVYVTGDTHGDIERFSEVYLPGESHLNQNDFVIVCGDFGFIFFNDIKESQQLDWLSNKPYTICFVDGNHENFPAIYNYPVIEWHGGKVHQIRKNIFHLMRGQVFNICGKYYFTMGGAYSIDRSFRTPGISWWSDELPNNEEYNEAIRNLKSFGMKIDYIITHTMPRKMILSLNNSLDVHDIELTGFLEWVMLEASYNHWYCGHWHIDKDINEDFSVLWYGVKTPNQI